MIRFTGCAGVVFGIILIVICGAYILSAPRAADLAMEVPVIRDWVKDVVEQVVYFPNIQYVFPLLGMFLIFWGVSLIQKQDWARVVGAVLNGLAGFYTLALVIVVAWLDDVARVRWWILLVGLLLALFFFYMAYHLLQKRTQWDFAKQYYNPNDFDLPARPKKPSAPITRPRVRQEEATPELARLIPADGGEEPFIIRERRVVIGREESHLLLDADDTSVSRKHATISLVDEQFVLEDSSRNGTLVNGQRIRNDQLALPDGAEIQFGRHAKFIFKSALGEKAPPQKAVEDVEPVVLARLEPLWSAGESFDIVKPRVIIGRDPKACDLALPPDEDLSVSSRHAELECTDQGSFILRDLDSSNGTYVDDVRVSEVELTDGVEIRLGREKTRFRFREG